ncbi:hypothetical protein [Corynebacterium ulceribovis]|uniref:hypothetical protein n=1 Tax=Corynebacterium ulceribovis TaxID=487732 RepID=UPI0012EA439F|nr:hypothetical protein [Corynebacterium ulceribovis]
MREEGPAAAIEEMLVDPDEFEDTDLREAAGRIDDEYRSYIDEIYDDIVLFDDAIEKIDEAIELIEERQ